MKLDMPDGTAIVLVSHEEGVVVATRGAQLPNGDLPTPSGLLVTGNDAELLGALIDVVEEAEVESVLGPRSAPVPEPTYIDVPATNVHRVPDRPFIR